MAKFTDIQSDFNRRAMRYDSYADLQKIIAKQSADHFLKLYAHSLPHNATLLDIGAGTGYLAQNLPDYTMLQLDCSPNMARIASQHGPAIVGQMEQLPLHNNSVDGVISSLALQWCTDPHATFSEISRVCKQHAILLTTLGADNLPELRTAFEHMEGHSQRIHTFHTPQLPSSLKAESHPLRMHYPNLKALLDSMRAIGAGNKNSSNTSPIRKSTYLALQDYYHSHFRDAEHIYATWDVIMVTHKTPLDIL